MRLMSALGRNRPVTAAPGFSTWESAMLDRLNPRSKAEIRQSICVLASCFKLYCFVPSFIVRPQFESHVDDISLRVLQAIHRHLFQDLYVWAGALRTVDVSKGSTRFANTGRIAPEADKLLRHFAEEEQLFALPHYQCISRLEHDCCKLNVIRPFRNRNGRAQRAFFEIICINAGYSIQSAPTERAEWVDANIAACNCQMQPLIVLPDRALLQM